MDALVSGATGFLGRRLIERLDRPRVLSRDAAAAARALAIPAERVHPWSPGGGAPPAAALAGVEAVFHLAGESVAGRWSGDKKRRILESRQKGTDELARAIAQLPSSARPRVLVSASAVGIYGDRGEEELDERAAPGEGFLAEVCKAWEAAADPARQAGVRVVHPRIGVVLGPGGALQAMRRPFQLGLGGRLGSGKQWMPWIHREDVIGILLHAVAREDLAGPINTVAPSPARNAEFTRALARALGRPAFLPAPGFALKIALGEFAGSLLGSQRVVPRAVVAGGYRFAFPEVEPALAEALGRPAPAGAEATSG